MTAPPRTPADAGARPMVAELAGLAEPAPARLVDRVVSVLDLGDRYVAVDVSFGRLYVAFNPRGISLVWLADEEESFRAAFARRWGSRPLRPADAAPPGLLDELAQRRSRARLRYDLSGLSPFQQAVLAKTAEIPRGEVRPYAWLAREVGQPAAVRAVGTALGRNPVPVLIPCHRVVRSDGNIGNYGLGPPVKHRLLSEEGVDLDELRQLAAAGVRFVGSRTTSIFCLPTCHAARRIEPANRVTFRSSTEAERASYRSCRLCRPAA